MESSRMKNRSTLMRADKDFKRIINAVRGRYLMEGKNPPTCREITKFIAKDVSHDEIFRRMVIRL